MDELNEHIVITVRESVDKVCPKVDVVKKKEPWEDAELFQLLTELRGCSEKGKLRKLQKEVKERRKYLKNKYYKELADNINTAAEARQVEKEFALPQKFTAIKTRSRLAISNEKLNVHFRNHFAAPKPEIPIPPELAEPVKYPYLNDVKVEVNEDIPGEKEVKATLKSFKNNKSAGTDIKTEGLKYNDSRNLICLVMLMLTLIWTCVKVPTSWLHVSITCLYKKGLMSLASNYRGLSIGANMSRILSKIIMMRFQKAYETHISEEQFGFRQNRSTSDCLFIVKTVIDKYGDTLIAVYIDLTAAYDHIPRDFLFRVLKLRTGATHLVEILKKMYEGTTASIRGMKTRFDVLVGCRQGGQESPCLFNYYFDYVLKIAAHEIDKVFPEGWGIDFQYNIPYSCTNREQRQRGRMHGIEIIRWILYADDVVVFCKSVREAEELLNIINDTCKRFGLTISYTKTKTQVFNDDKLADLPTLFSIGEQQIENVKEFVYVGQNITTKENCCFTEHRIARAYAKFNELRNVLCDVNVNIHTRKKLLDSCVRARLIYGTQAWYPTEKQMSHLETGWNELLRSMVKGGWTRKKSSEGSDEAEYAFKYTNDQIKAILKTTALRDTINSQYLQYIAHICRASNNAITKKMLFATAKRKYYRDPWIKIADMLQISVEQAKRVTQSRGDFAELVRQRFNSTP